MTKKTNIHIKLVHCKRLTTVVVLSLLIPQIAAYADPFTPSTFLPAQEETKPTCQLKEELPECFIEANEQVTSLVRGTTAEGTLKGGQRHWHKLSLSRGQFLQIVVDQLGIDVTVSACVAGGLRLTEVDRQNGSRGPETLSLIANVDGDVRLQVKARGGKESSGRYTIRIKEIREATSLDQTRIDAERLINEAGKYYDAREPNCLEQSIKKFEMALKLWQQLGEDYEFAIASYGLGWSYSDLGAYGGVKFPSPNYRLRWSYESREDHLSALKHFGQALSMMTILKDPHGQAIAFAGRGWPNLYLGKGEDALADFSQAQQLFHSMGNKPGEVRAVYGIGWTFASLNDNSKALDSLSRALQLREELGDRRGGAHTMAALSRVYSRLGRNKEALDYGHQALRLYEQFKDEHGQASTNTILGWIHRAMGQSQEAIDSFRAALDLRRGTDLTGRANALYGIARIEDEMGEMQKAQTRMTEVLDTIEPLREKGETDVLRTYYFANVQEYYEFYIDLLMRLHQSNPAAGYAEQALEINERARARELLAVLAQSDRESYLDYDSELVKPLDAVRIRQLLDDETLLLTYSLGTERSYLWLVSSRSVWSYVLPRRSQIEGTAVRLYQTMTERNNTPASQYLSAKQTIERRDAQAQELAEQLSAIVLGPVVERLGSKRLVIVTQGALQLVPFGALPLPGTSSSPKVFKPVIVDHEVVGLPSASVLRMLRTNAERKPGGLKTIAVLADPVFTREDPRVQPNQQSRPNNVTLRSETTFSQGQVSRDEADAAVSQKNYRRLPGTRWEAQQISSMVPENERFIALDFAASRDTVMSEELTRYRIIHFATHAFVDDANPDQSKIVLSQVDAQGRQKDGNLMLVDVYNLKLKADLVALSACRTGLGVDTKGEGLIGLTGGFMHSGVPRVLVSLWPVSDSVTAEFMVRFYRRLLGPREMTAAAALREVQIEFWKDDRWQQPYFWAPFIIEGEWR